MEPYVIISDSCCDLPAQMAQDAGMEILPLSVQIGDESFANYLDGRELTSKELFTRIRGGAMPSTSAVSVGLFEDAMVKHLQAGSDILCITFTSALSTTHQSAVIAANELREQYPQRTIHVVDSLCASLGQGLLLKLCAEKQAAGATLEEALSFAKDMAPRVDGWFSVEDLNHLKRGGRISATSAAVGSLLSIKPILRVNAEGKLENVGKERGRKGALAALVNKVATLATEKANYTMFVGHADCEEDAQFVAQQLVEKAGVPAENILIQMFGAVIGSHIGPGTVGVFFVGDSRL